jgi:hypothetical protein
MTRNANVKVTTSDSTGNQSNRAGTTVTASAPDTSTTTTVEGPEDERVRTVLRTGAEKKSSIEFTFKIAIQNRNAVDPATLL